MGDAIAHPDRHRGNGMLSGDTLILFVLPALILTGYIAVRRGLGFARTFLLLTFVGYIGAVIAVTMFPIPLDPQLIADRTVDGILRNNFVPFATMVSAFRDGPDYFALQVLGNLVLLVPFGFLLPVVWVPARRAKMGLRAILIAALSIEAAQLVVSAAIGYTYRQADIDDVILNVLGGMLGFGMFTLCSYALERWDGRRSSVSHSQREVGTTAEF